MLLQVVGADTGVDDATVAVTDDATQVIDDHKSSDKPDNVDETVAIADAETQVITNADTGKSRLNADDATQVFENVDENVKNTKNPGKYTGTDATLVINDGNDEVSGCKKESSEESVALFMEEQTQVFEDHSRPKGRVMNKKKDTEVAETQVFDNDATQVIDTTTEERKIDDIATQVLDNNDQKEEKGQKILNSKIKNVAKEETQAFSDEETFDITSAATLAPDAEVVRDGMVTADDATQVCIFPPIFKNVFYCSLTCLIFP